MPDKDSAPSRVDDEWETTGAVPLPPGWINVYEHEDPSVAEHEYSPCPALLTQERRRSVRVWNRAGKAPVVETTPHEPPYLTQVVFADQENGVLSPANDAFNYVHTIYRPGAHQQGLG